MFVKFSGVGRDCSNWENCGCAGSLVNPGHSWFSAAGTWAVMAVGSIQAPERPGESHFSSMTPLQGLSLVVALSAGTSEGFVSLRDCRATK